MTSQADTPPLDVIIPSSLRPKQKNFDFELEKTLSAIVGISSRIPETAHSAQTLGTKRIGHGVFIKANGLVVTVAYLAMEADEIWLSLSNGHKIQAHALAFDFDTGLCLLQPLAHITTPYLSMGSAKALKVHDRVILAGAGGLHHAIASEVVARQSFAGYWEYLIHNAILTSPAHPQWGGAAMINDKGELVGIGSLQLEQESEQGETEALNLCIPIDVLPPILDELISYGRPNRPARPWLGCHAAEIENQIVIIGISKRSPARRADLRTGDIVRAIDGKPLSSLSDFWRHLWSAGPAGCDVKLTLFREDTEFDVTIRTTERMRVMRQEKLH
jgi:S1-C subfamily serine protease